MLWSKVIKKGGEALRRERRSERRGLRGVRKCTPPQWGMDPASLIILGSDISKVIITVMQGNLHCSTIILIGK